MSNTNPMEPAAGQTVQTAAVALQVLVLAAQALSEASRRTVPAPAPQPSPVREILNPDHDRYAHLVRGIVQPPAVAEAMVTAPQWATLGGELKKLEHAGVNVGQFLTDAAPLIARMDTDLRAGAAAPGVTVAPTADLRNPWAPPPGQRRATSDAPGIVQRVVDRVTQAVARLLRKDQPTTALGERSRELARLGIGAQENSRLVIVARESLATESLLGQMVISREWPGIASQIKKAQEAGHNPRQALAGVPQRMQQAAAAGITLSPSDAARGLLADQTRTAATATAAPALMPTPAAPASPAKAAATSAENGTVPASSPARAAAAAARSTTAKKSAEASARKTAEPRPAATKRAAKAPSPRRT
ncbi:hypothetical protein [Streptomyces sp. IB2014 011-1]|uniref:hypothetical protein n=1 Tax=Streptomyces sp. IB2014 011-1 TaxID=1844478 RepID=UPI0009C967EC|nr:hypothetical protein [Streptomyces sp. IB2014 011-1]ONI48508.1 hypothetical protein STIB_73330 [Streptomyces sp. IB2014 011-1]